MQNGRSESALQRARAQHIVLCSDCGDDYCTVPSQADLARLSVLLPHSDPCQRLKACAIRAQDVALQGVARVRRVCYAVWRPVELGCGSHAR